MTEDEQTTPEQATAQVGDAQPENDPIAELSAKVDQISDTVNQLATIVVAQEKKLSQKQVVAPAASKQVKAPKTVSLPDHVYRFRSRFTDQIFFYRRSEISQATGALVLSKEQYPINFKNGLVDINTQSDPYGEDKLRALRANEYLGRDYFEDPKAQVVEGVVVLEGPAGTQREPAERTPIVDDAPLVGDLV